jgi:hypothetical protein
MYRITLYQGERGYVTTVGPMDAWPEADAALTRRLETGLYTGGTIEQRVRGIGWVLRETDPAAEEAPV